MPLFTLHTLSRSAILATGIVLAACSPGKQPQAPVTGTGDESAQTAAAADGATPPADRQAYFGALHVHTSLSFDAFTNGTRTMPEDAFRWAKGEAIEPGLNGVKNQVQTPYDFYIVSEHAEMLGSFREMQTPGTAASMLPIARRVLSSDPAVAAAAFTEILRDLNAGALDPVLLDPKITQSTWRYIADVVDKYYEPGKFTTFLGFEWTSSPDNRNMHRIVVFGDNKVLPDLPFSTQDSQDPEALWAWMDAQRARGSVLFATGHNGNSSDGRMFEQLKFDGQTPIDAGWVEARSRNEPLYELTQIKGTSETFPSLSPNDEFAGFELWDYTLSAETQRPKVHAGSYARQALVDGLAIEARGLGNPFKFGFYGDNDTHAAAGSNEEFNHSGKFGIEMLPGARLKGLPGLPAGQVQQIREFSSGGLAGVWADENTRESLYAAMLRRETFATSGSWIRVRMFGGFGLAQADLEAPDFAARGYAKGVPMGGDLKAASGTQAPTFLVRALKDPKGANLDRIQIIKGWLDAEGGKHEKIFDVAWAGDRKAGADGKLAAIGNTVDLKTATYTNDIGAPELSVAWTDPEFQVGERAVYYARVLEIPTPRWSTYDSVKLGLPLPEDLPHTIQERAWSSPIWYTPL
jgi:hypothetical protein